MAFAALTVCLLSLALMVLTFYYFTCRFSYWKIRGVKFVKPYFLVGSMLSVFTLREHMVDFFQRIYQSFEGEPFAGFFQGRSPSLLVRDPDLAKNILVKDFAHFTDHGFKVRFECENSVFSMYYVN
jgi:hypothetical protein